MACRSFQKLSEESTFERDYGEITTLIKNTFEKS